MVLDLEWNLDILNQTLSLVLAEFGGVQLEGEIERSRFDNLHWFLFVNFNTSFNFCKNYIITFLINMSLVLMHSDNSLGLSIFNHRDDK